MNIKTRVALMVVGLTASLLAPVLFACTEPPVEGISRSWRPNALILVTYDANLNLTVGGAGAPVSTAVNNWNAAITQNWCNSPYFAFVQVGTTATMNFAYAVPPPDTNGVVPSGHTDMFITTRINSADTVINTKIPLTFPTVLTSVIAHEIGHTMGLNDCIGCVPGDNVMVDMVLPYTSVQGTLAPTPCDLQSVIVNAPDYRCAPGTGGGGGPCGKDSHGCGSSPIVLNLDGRGFSLTNAEDGVEFDISGTGNPVQMGWTAKGADDGFLALPGSSGLVHDGKELFGNFTPQPPSQTPNGFAALSVYDQPDNGGNGDGLIDARDAIFPSLRVWVDENHDGICQPDELHKLLEVGVTSISLEYRYTGRTDQYGNRFRYTAPVTPGNIQAYDVFFVTETKSALTKVPYKCNVTGDQSELSLR